ncbi:hypothetical protein BLNAU_11490 [Blattamonas nauphoetae]|uniref:Uncharacterized protein n=1 Tax=Blattamonas nauphoetae TaxID=2049346 RepID=A0ABQ9XNK0_9EUKA|nr:hypothetical protein BLNAU_11490 [Blattamonas nauphoetae]
METALVRMETCLDRLIVVGQDADRNSDEVGLPPQSHQPRDEMPSTIHSPLWSSIRHSNVFHSCSCGSHAAADLHSTRVRLAMFDVSFEIRMTSSTEENQRHTFPLDLSSIREGHFLLGRTISPNPSPGCPGQFRERRPGWCIDVNLAYSGRKEENVGEWKGRRRDRRAVCCEWRSHREFYAASPLESVQHLLTSRRLQCDDEGILVDTLRTLQKVASGVVVLAWNHSASNLKSSTPFSPTRDLIKSTFMKIGSFRDHPRIDSLCEALPTILTNISTIDTLIASLPPTLL